MLEVAGLLTVPQHADWLCHSAPDSGEVKSAQPGSDLLSDDDARDKQVADGPLEELLIGNADDSEHSILVLELVEVEKVGERLILIVASDRSKR